jgi:putative copper export protein
MASSPKLFTPSSYVTLVAPIITLALALLLHNRVLLDYIHVICGGTWTGIDLFMGLVMSRIMKGLTPDTRSEVVKRLVPVMLFLMPALASVAITAGIYLAQWEAC